MRAGVAILGPPRPDRCTGDLTKSVYELCDDAAYRKAVTPYLANHMQLPIYPPDQRRKWRRTMARWFPCMFEALEDASPCRRLAAVRLLDAIANPAAVDPLIALLRRVPRDAPEATAARRSLSETFRTQKVVPFLVEAAHDPSLECLDAFAGFTNGVRDPRLLDASLDAFEAWKADPKRHRCWSGVLQQAAADPENPRLGDVAAYYLGKESERSSVFQMALQACPGHDCGWLRRAFVRSSGGKCSSSDFPMTRFLVEQAGPGKAAPFLRALLNAAPKEPCRSQVAGLLLTTVCDIASSGTPDKAIRCLEALPPDARAEASWKDEISLSKKICRYSHNRPGDPACWARLRDVFQRNGTSVMALRVFESWALLNQDQALDSGALDRSATLLRGIESRYFNDFRVAALCEEAIKKNQHLHWLRLSREAASTLSVGRPQPLTGKETWTVTVTGPEALVSQLTGVPVAAFVWFRTEDRERGGRSASLKPVAKGGGWVRYEMTVDPFPDRSVSHGQLVHVTLLFLGTQDLAPRMALTWNAESIQPFRRR